MISFKLNIFSNVLSMNNDCRILLPDHAEKEEKLKVLWLLHGGSGDENEWIYYSEAAEIPDREHIAVILVNGNDSCFTDMAYGLRFSTYVGEELPEILCRMFPQLSSDREDNYISGLSNGGYGCLLIGLSHPERYSAIGAFSAGDKADARYAAAEDERMTPRIRMFGQNDIRNTEYSIRFLAEKVSSGTGEKPRIYHACGSEDPWLDLNLLFRETMEQLNDSSFDYVYDQIDGLGHEWKFWNEELRRFIEYLKR